MLNDSPSDEEITTRQKKAETGFVICAVMPAARPLSPGFDGLAQLATGLEELAG